MSKKSNNKFVKKKKLNYSDVEMFYPLKTSEDVKNVLGYDIEKMGCLKRIPYLKSELVIKLIIEAFNIAGQNHKFIYSPINVIDIPEDSSFPYHMDRI